VHWAGWESDTYTLQQNGWELSAEQDVRMMALRIALRHKAMQCVAVTSLFTDFRYEYYAREPIDVPFLNIQYFATRMSVQVMERQWPNFQPIDAAPQFLSDTTVKSFEDLKWFATPLARTEEIIVDPLEVGAMLEQIRKMQAPEQERIRQKQRLAASREGMSIDAMPRQQFHAQIISIADGLPLAA
jgi:hypothetical protein